MNDIEQLLGSVTPRGVRPELRPQVLAAVASRLQADRQSRWMRRSALAVAASIFVGVGLNVWLSQMSERHLAQLFGPPPVSKRAMEIADMVREVTDAETAQLVYRQLTAPRPSGDGQAAYTAYCKMLKQLADESIFKEPFDETPQKGAEMERDRAGRAGGDPFGCQRVVRLDYRCTA
jgi:hypothetical protein